MTDKLFKDHTHFRACHERWMEKRNRKQEEPGYKDEWYAEQCGMCKYFAPLSGAFAEDYGVCSNSSSEFDGFVRFEHDGCDVFSESEGW
jgi:hypothetical protein